MTTVLQVDSEGVVITLTLVDSSGAVVDVSGATTKNIILDPPNAAAETHAASFVTDGTDGKITYTTVAGDLDSSGDWRIQAEITTGDGTWKSQIGRFVVRENLS